MAVSAAQSAARKLGSLLVEEAQFLYGVEDKVDELQQELVWMQGFLEDVDMRQHHEELIRIWVSHIRDLAYKAEDVIEMYIHKVQLQHRSGGGRDSLWGALKTIPCILAHARTIHDVGSQIDGLSKKILKLNTRLKSYGVDMRRVEDYSVQYAISLRDLRQTYSHTVDKDLIRRDQDINPMVVELLADHHKNNTSVVGVVGMGGLGKTTLVREVLRNDAVRHRFGNPAWVYVSQQPNKRRILQETLRALEPEEDVARLSDEEMCHTVSRVLKERRCLVVLDDIWYEGTWLLLDHVFSGIKQTNSKLILTTRNGDVVDKVDPNAFILKPPCLNAQQSWTLLLKKAFPDSNDQQIEPKMEEVGKRMLKHCDGLPMAIVSLGGALATKKTSEEWEAVEKSIGKYFTKRGVGFGRQDEIGVTQVLELSYNDLPFYLKPCFLCFANFPEDCEIPTDLLYQLWQAEGLVQVPEEDQARSHLFSIYDVSEQYLNMLVIRCMVEVGEIYSSGRIKTCRIHDMMREMCVSKCKEEKFLEVVVDDPVKLPALFGRCHRVAVHLGNDERSVVSFFSCRQENALRPRSVVVHAPIYNRIRFHMSKAFVLLRVLRMEGFAIEELPQELGRCVHLRYLSMWLATDLKGSSVVWKLSYLQTLDLQGSKPGIRIANKLYKLRKLLHLYLPSRYGFTDEKLQLSNASQMETLVNVNIVHLDEQHVQKMTNLRLLSFQPIETDLVDLAVPNSMIMNSRLLEQPQVIIVPNTLYERMRRLAHLD